MGSGDAHEGPGGGRVDGLQGNRLAIRHQRCGGGCSWGLQVTAGGSVRGDMVRSI